jgi:hypothetical protein
MEKTRKRVKKVDGVIEAAHFDPEGHLLWVRAYERRGPTWSDLVLIDRSTLILRLKSGKRFYLGTRREFWASEFDLGERLRLVQGGVKPVLMLGKGGARQDKLEGIPVV